MRQPCSSLCIRIIYLPVETLFQGMYFLPWFPQMKVFAHKEANKPIVSSGEKCDHKNTDWIIHSPIYVSPFRLTGTEYQFHSWKRIYLKCNDYNFVSFLMNMTYRVRLVTVVVLTQATQWVPLLEQDYFPYPEHPR